MQHTRKFNIFHLNQHECYEKPLEIRFFGHKIVYSKVKEKPVLSVDRSIIFFLKETDKLVVCDDSFITLKNPHWIPNCVENRG